MWEPSYDSKFRFESFYVCWGGGGGRLCAFKCISLILDILVIFPGDFKNKSSLLYINRIWNSLWITVKQLGLKYTNVSASHNCNKSFYITLLLC